MQKVYLLLRSNKQTGPYTLDELVAHNLKPVDLVWVEGKSFGWSYPNEIESLKPFVEIPSEEYNHLKTQPSNNDRQVSDNSYAPVNKKIFVSMPIPASGNMNSISKPTNKSIQQKGEEDKGYNLNYNAPAEPEYDHQALERKAEELRKRAQSYTPSKSITNNEETVEIKYAKTLEEVEAEYTSWMYQKKTKKKKQFSKEQLLSAFAVIAVIAGGWFIGSHIFNKSENADQVVHVQNSFKEEIVPVVSFGENKKNITMDNNDHIPQEEALIIKKSQPAKKIEQEHAEPEIVDDIVVSTPVDEQQTTDIFEKPDSKTEEPVAEVEKPKKKTLGESVNEVFRKLIKNDEEETKSEPSNGERKSNRRGDVTPVQTDISDQVEVKMNNNTENWMMGVIGLKITLYNRSALTLKTADIDILYYNDQKKLIDKKRITFSEIASKKSQTLSAPDHRLADHAEYKIISAFSTQDAYAKN